MSDKVIAKIEINGKTFEEILFDYKTYVNKELNDIKKEIEEKDKLLKFFFADKELSKDDIIEIINEHIRRIKNEEN